MKKTPLKRKTELKSKTQLKSKTPLKTKKTFVTKTKIKFRSKKMEKIYVERRELVRRLLKERSICEIQWSLDCTGKSVDVHERVARSVGGRIVGGSDEEYITTCRYCHTQVTDNPKEAHSRGFIKRSWE